MILLTTIKKDFQILLNSKLSSLILILGPIFLILIMGVALKDSSIKNIQAGVYYENESEFVNNFLDELRSRSYIITRETNLDECKKHVINTQTHVCIELQEYSRNNFDINRYNVNLYVDFSKQRVVWKIIGSISWIVEQQSDKTVQLIATDLKTNAEKIITQTENREGSIDSMINNMESLEEEIQELQYQKDNTITKINELRNRLKILNESMRALNKSIGKMVDVSGINIGTTLSEGIKNIEEIDLQLGKIASEELASNAVSKTKNQITFTTRELANTKDTLKEIKKDLGKIEGVDAQEINNPIVLTYKSVSNEQEGEIKEELSFLDYLFPSFLIFFILFSSMLISAIITIKERSSNAYVRNITSKNNGVNFVISAFLTSLIILLIQTSILLILSNYFLSISPFERLFSLMGVLFLSASLFILIGIALGYIFNSYESTITAAISIILTFFIFSSIVTPTETLTKTLAKIANLLPLTLLETKLRIILIFNSTLKFFQNEIFSMLVAFFIVISLIFVFYKKNKSKEI